MDTHILSISYPSFIIVETDLHLGSDKNVLCRVFADNESVIESGEFRYSVCDSYGRVQPVTIVVPDRAVLRLPNKTSLRMELLDRILRTQFVEVIGDCVNDSVPSALSVSNCHFQRMYGRVRLDYLAAIQDPGMQAVIDEGKWIEFLTGESDVEQFKTNVAQIKFGEGDTIPVQIGGGTTDRFAVLKLLEPFAPDCFDCELWLSSQTKLLDDEYSVSRHVSAKQLNQSNGEMEIQDYVKVLGSVRVLRSFR